MILLRRPILLMSLSVAFLCGLSGGMGCFFLSPANPRFALALASASDRKSFPGFPHLQMHQLLAFSDNGDFVLTGRIHLDRQGRLQVWNAREGRLVATVGIGAFPMTQSDWKFQAALSSDGNYLAAVAYTGELYRPSDLVLWSTVDETEVWRLSLAEPLIERPHSKEPIGGHIETLRFAPDLRSLWVTTDYRSLQLNLKDHALIQTIWHTGTTIAFSADGRQAAFCSEGWSLLDIASKRRVAHFPFDTRYKFAGHLEFADSGRVVMASMPPENAAGQNLFNNHLDSTDPFKADPRRPGLRLFEASTWVELAHFSKESFIAISTDGQKLVSTDGTSLRIRDTVSGGELLARKLPVPFQASVQVSSQPNGRFLCWMYRWSHETPDVQIRDLMTWESLGIILCDATKCAMNRQGNTVAAIQGNQLSIYDWPISLSSVSAIKFGGLCALLGYLASSLVVVIRHRRRAEPDTHV